MKSQAVLWRAVRFRPVKTCSLEHNRGQRLKCESWTTSFRRTQVRTTTGSCSCPERLGPNPGKGRAHGAFGEKRFMRRSRSGEPPREGSGCAAERSRLCKKRSCAHHRREKASAQVERKVNSPSRAFFCTNERSPRRGLYVRKREGVSPSQTPERAVRNTRNPVVNRPCQGRVRRVNHPGATTTPGEGRACRATTGGTKQPISRAGAPSARRGRRRGGRPPRRPREAGGPRRACPGRRGRPSPAGRRCGPSRRTRP